jgi:oligopeptide/dipeptide ABC transporter ATP-binding protein
MTPALEARGLHVTYSDGTYAARDVSLAIAPGACHALVGESGCGKTTIARAILGLLPPDTHVSGSIRVGTFEVVGASSRQLRDLRGRVVGYVAQNPFASLNPLLRVEHNVAEAWRAHGEAPPAGALQRVLRALGIVDPERTARRWPHEWSGGMLQRASIATAAARAPAVIVADEPTSALDDDLARSTLEALRSTGAALLLVSHDLEMVAGIADEVSVCYGGRIVEQGSAQLLRYPRHPYTRALRVALPRVGGDLPVPLEGAPPDLLQPDQGCPFAPRCPLAQPDCCNSVPLLIDGVACPVVSA